MCTEIRHTENEGMAIALAKHGVYENEWGR